MPPDICYGSVSDAIAERSTPDSASFTLMPVETGRESPQELDNDYIMEDSVHLELEKPAIWINPKSNLLSKDSEGGVQGSPLLMPLRRTSTSGARREHDYLRMVLTANVYKVAVETPLTILSTLSDRLLRTSGSCVELYIKREDLQPVFSFKIRGAYNRMSQLTEREKRNGVVTCSAGNHAQGVALSAKILGVRATIVMPTVTPPIKWQNVQRLGASVILHGGDFDAAKEYCHKLAAENNWTVIPPYDDPFVIAGQGTIAAEIMRQVDPMSVDAIFCPIGGGGLIAGVSAYVKRLFPHIRIVGVETYDADAMTQSLRLGKRVKLLDVGGFADGTAVKLVGKETFRICKRRVDETVLVTTDETCAAIRDVFMDTRSVMEPSGALAVAGVKKWLLSRGEVVGTGKKIIAITSGANMNFDRLKFVSDRAEVGDRKLVLMIATIPEKPGTFCDFYQLLLPSTITEFSYRYDNPERATVFCAFAVNPLTRDAHVAEVLAKLKANSMHGIDVSNFEMAKSHARHLIGGGKKNLPCERLYRFEFPERPGALGKFLTNLLPQWNVSLFHYVFTGGDKSKVLVGIQIPPLESDRWKEFLGTLNYSYVEETDSELFQLFLK